MKFGCMLFAALAGIFLAEAQDVSCPTPTKTIINPECDSGCGTENCLFQMSLDVPCGCPESVPTATLYAPCEVGCPYMGCSEVEWEPVYEECPEPEPTTTCRGRWCWPIRPTTTTTTTTEPEPTTTSTSSSSSYTGVVVTVTSVGGPTTTPCPTATRTMRPSDCPVLECPLPTCVSAVVETMTLGCGCDEPVDMLLGMGCRTECETACPTRTITTKEECPTMGGW